MLRSGPFRSRSQRSPSLYLDSTKLEPVQKGVAVLKQRAGTTKLSAEGIGGQVALCDDRGAQEPHHHGDGVGAGAAAALPVPQQLPPRAAPA